MRAVSKTSKALSSRTIVWWAAGLAATAAAAVTLLWLFLGGGDQVSARRLDALRTAASIVIGAGGAAALLLAARRQRYVELDLEQKEHDANERRVTELYGKAADQLGSDKAPVRMAGVYALERLAQDQAQHRQTVVNLLCAYLRMPYTPPKDETDKEAAQEQLVRTTVQDVLETHLRPAAPDSFWPDIDLRITGATLEFFWFRHCRVRNATFRHTTFLKIAAFRDSEFTDGADFHRVHFTGTADLRRTAFGPRRANFRSAIFDGDVEFGEEPQAGRTLDLTDTTAGATAKKREWPTGWHEEPSPDDRTRVHVVPDEARPGGAPDGGQT
ncbi:pentapeptide repeat-containing protein [Actinophytocola sp.]|uniref:pentapeptide repeat-containing protein n=1 Tax=Actinophytocola sp. TaxID=1872138 RepID=UPI003C72C76A